MKNTIKIAVVSWALPSILEAQFADDYNSLEPVDITMPELILSWLLVILGAWLLHKIWNR